MVIVKRLFALCERQLLRRGGGFLLGLSDHVFGDEFGLETDDSVGIGDDGLRVVLRDVAGAAGFSCDDEGAFAGGGPVGGAFGGDTAIGDEAFGVGDLM